MVSGYRLLLSVSLAVLLGNAAPAKAVDMTGKACFADDGQERAICIVMIGATRGLVASSKNVDPACPVSDPHDMKVSYGVIDWIRARPERKDEELGPLIREALLDVDPCTRAVLTSDDPLE